MINVLHLRDTDRVCGPGKTIIETACATDRSAFSQMVGLFLPNGTAHNRYYEEAVRRGVDVVPVRSAHPYDPRLVRTLVQILKARRIDVLHSHEYKSDLLAFAASRLHRVPIVTTVHGWITTSSKRRFFIGMSRKVLPHFDRVIAVSHETKRRIVAHGVPGDLVTVIHNGIVSRHYHRDGQVAGFLRQRFNLPAGAVLIANIGRLSPEKGQRDFIDAAALIASAHPEAYFVLVGDGPDRGVLESYAASRGVSNRVLFAGYIDDPRPVYRDIDVLALTSHTEGLPNVVLEAMCMEVPVLATDVGGTREVVEPDVSGLLVDAHAPEQIATRLAGLLRDRSLARALVAGGRRRAQEHFEFQGRVEREEQLYRELLEHKVH
jgi:glycosyltransferase involved in cell wall biosynthesis